MTREEIQRTVLAALEEVAPEIAEIKLDPNANMRDELDLDSMDFLNLVKGVHERLKVDIPEADYGKVGTLKAMTDYVAGLL